MRNEWMSQAIRADEWIPSGQHLYTSSASAMDILTFCYGIWDSPIVQLVRSLEEKEWVENDSASSNDSNSESEDRVQRKEQDRRLSSIAMTNHSNENMFSKESRTQRISRTTSAEYSAGRSSDAERTSGGPIGIKADSPDEASSPMEKSSMNQYLDSSASTSLFEPCFLFYNSRISGEEQLTNPRFGSLPFTKRMSEAICDVIIEYTRILSHWIQQFCFSATPRNAPDGFKDLSQTQCAKNSFQKLNDEISDAERIEVQKMISGILKPT